MTGGAGDVVCPRSKRPPLGEYEEACGMSGKTEGEIGRRLKGINGDFFIAYFN